MPGRAGGPRFTEHRGHQEALAVVAGRRLQGLGRGQRGPRFVGAEHVLGVERMGERCHGRGVDLGQLRYEADDLLQFSRHPVEFVGGQGQSRERRDLGDVLPGE
jgi:hypothetical protein